MKNLNVGIKIRILVTVYPIDTFLRPTFIKLQKMLAKGINLLIIEIDGPHQESLNYYKEQYHVNDYFIQQDTMLINQDHLDIVLNDVKHAFGHGYCLAACLLNLNI